MRNLHFLSTWMRTTCMVSQCQNHYLLMVLIGWNIYLKYDFIKNYDKDSDKGYTLDVDAEYPKNLHDVHSDFPFLPERMKIDKCNKPVCNLYYEKNYIAHIRSLKQTLNHGLILKKVDRVIQFN